MTSWGSPLSSIVRGFPKHTPQGWPVASTVSPPSSLEEYHKKKIVRIRIRNRLFGECTGNTLVIWSHTSTQNNDESPITKWWRGSLRFYIYIYIYIHTHTHIHTYAMYSNRLFRAPASCAARNPTAKSRGSREQRDQACMLIVSPRNLTGNSAELLPWCLSNLRAIGKKSKARISQPRDPKKSRGGTTARPAEEDPDVLCVEMFPEANLPLAQTPPQIWSDARNTM